MSDPQRDGRNLHRYRSRIAALTAAAKPFLDAFTYNPGHSDLDNEQPITIRVTLGDWRKLSYELRRNTEEQ